MGIFKGIRILDLSRLLPGGVCTKLFADLGAEVIKVEEPNNGDYSRWEKPIGKKESYYHLIINGNKKSIKLNLKSSGDKTAFLKLVKQSDVVFENFRPGVMARLGIDYETLRQQNSSIILCSMSGFGQNSPYSNIKAHDINFLAMSGFLSLMIEEDKEPKVPPVPISDIISALCSAFAISAALFEKKESGEGQHIDISMYDSLMWSLSFIAGKYFMNQNSFLGEFAGVTPSYSIYQTSEGRHIALGAFEDQFWQDFCKKIGRQDLIPFGKSTAKKGKEVRKELETVFKAKKSDEWIEFFRDSNVCISPVRQIDEAFNDIHTKARELTYSVEHPIEGDVTQLSHPIKYSRTNRMEKRPAPGFGEHTEEVFKKYYM